MTIWVISDGKPGHLSQSLGLVKALGKLVPVDSHVIDIEGMGWFRALQTARKADLPKPDIIIGAGHKTHLPILAAARKHKALSFVCMSPSLPRKWFDICFVPYHDLASSAEELEQIYEDLEEGNISLAPCIFPTMGAMHRITPNPGASKDFTLILIGGPSKFFSWNTERLVKQIRRVVRNTEGKILLTTSRRTPKPVLPRLREEFPGIEFHPVEETGPDWVPEHLEHARSVWVTEDSVSMIFEAVGSGAFVGLLEVPKKPVGTPRVAAGIRLLQKKNYAYTYSQWKADKVRPRKAPPLKEADRAAAYVLERYPQFNVRDEEEA